LDKAAIVVGRWSFVVGHGRKDRNVNDVAPRVPVRSPEGVVSLLLTPFRTDGSINWAAYDAYVDWQLALKPAGLFAVCGSSEMKWLTADERYELARRAVQRSAGIPVVATANLHGDIARHHDELLRMAETGVAGVVLVPPAPISHDRARYKEYLLSLASAAPCPVLLYEWPQVEHHLVDPDLFGELAHKRLIAGIKDTTCTYDGIAAKQKVAGEAVVYQANTPFLLDALTLGVKGIMAVTSTARADLVIELWQRFHRRADDVAELHRELVFLDGLLRMAYPATAKYLVSLQGIAMPLTTRWPVQLTVEMVKALEVWQRRYSPATSGLITTNGEE